MTQCASYSPADHKLGGEVNGISVLSGGNGSPSPFFVEHVLAVTAGRLRPLNDGLVDGVLALLHVEGDVLANALPIAELDAAEPIGHAVVRDRLEVRLVEGVLAAQLE